MQKHRRTLHCTPLLLHLKAHSAVDNTLLSYTGFGKDTELTGEHNLHPEQ